MARKRMIDTDDLYYRAGLVRALREKGVLFFIRLDALAEDWGGYEYSPDSIALHMGAVKVSPREVERFIKILIDNGEILSYQINGKIYHWLTGFSKRQTIKKGIPPKLPLPEWIQCDLEKYDSGKRYAKYTEITSRLPVGYQHPTGNGRTETEVVEQEEKIEPESKNTLPLRACVSEVDCQTFVGLWNEICTPLLPEVTTISKPRETTIRARLKQRPDLDHWKQIFTRIINTPFLRGEGDRGWRADFDWVMNPNNLIKIVEGKYSVGQNINKPKTGMAALEELYGEFMLNEPTDEHKSIDVTPQEKSPLEPPRPEKPGPTGNDNQEEDPPPLPPERPEVPPEDVRREIYRKGASQILKALQGKPDKGRPAASEPESLQAMQITESEPPDPAEPPGDVDQYARNDEEEDDEGFF